MQIQQRKEPIMQLAIKNKIKTNDRKLYDFLREQCHLSKNIYNQGIFLYRMMLDAYSKLTPEEKVSLTKEDKKKYYLSPSGVYKIVNHENPENLKLLPAYTANSIWYMQGKEMSSYFALLKKKKGTTGDDEINPPRYKPTGDKGYHTLFYDLDQQTTKIIKEWLEKGYFQIPVSPTYVKTHEGFEPFKIPIPKNLISKKIKQIRIVPNKDGTEFESHFIYEAGEQATPKENATGAVAIDIGVQNLASCVNTNNGHSFIIDGKYINNINIEYNKRISYLQRINSFQKKKAKATYTKQMNSIKEHRNNQVKEYMQLAAKKIIDYAISNNVAKIIVGYSIDFKRNSNIGRNNNRRFNQIPFGVLRQKLNYLSEINGIEYIEHEESYTSKASFLDNDPIPVYEKGRKNKSKTEENDNISPDANTKKEKHVFSGKRVNRGKYRAADGIEINADINGAANIGRKQGEEYSPEAIENIKRWPRRVKVISENNKNNV